MKHFKVEYLITFEQKASFCNSIPAFNNLLRTIDDISIEANSIEFQGQKIGYDVQTGEILNDKQRFFHVKLTFSNEKLLNEYENLLRVIRTVLSKAGEKPVQVLWDGISLYYAEQAYPLIYDIENTMRKLITKFMLINVGLGWTNETVPQEVLESIRSNSPKNNVNYLYEVDFIQLSNFLFKEYTTVNPNSLIDKFRKAKKIEELELPELKAAIPRSNWDRYFSGIVECDSEYLRIRWGKLYDRRNQVAHNKPISNSEFKEIINLIDELKPKLQKAIDNLDQVTVLQEDREAVSENAAGSISLIYNEFILSWNHLHHSLYELALLSAPDEGTKYRISHQFQNNFRGLLNIVVKDHKLLSRDFKDEVLDLFKLRNIIVHQTDVIIPYESLQKYIEGIRQLTDELWSAISDIQVKGVNIKENNIDSSESLQQNEGSGDEK